MTIEGWHSICYSMAQVVKPAWLMPNARPLCCVSILACWIFGHIVYIMHGCNKWHDVLWLYIHLVSCVWRLGTFRRILKMDIHLEIKTVLCVYFSHIMTHAVSDNHTFLSVCCQSGSVYYSTWSQHLISLFRISEKSTIRATLSSFHSLQSSLECHFLYINAHCTSISKYMLWLPVFSSWIFYSVIMARDIGREFGSHQRFTSRINWKYNLYRFGNVRAERPQIEMITLQR